MAANRQNWIYIMNNKIINFAALAILALTMSGCMPKAENLDQKTYMLSAPTTIPEFKTQPASLQINDTSIVTTFSDMPFVYRTSDILYTKDFYNLFFIPATQQFNQIFYRTFQKADLFMHVEQPGALISINYLLKTTINELYADYRNPKQPVAVMELQISLYHKTKTGIKNIFNRTYREAAPITPQNSVGLINGWNEDLKRLLPQIMVDVNQAVKS